MASTDAGTQQAHSCLRALALATPLARNILPNIHRASSHHLADSLVFLVKNSENLILTFYMALRPPFQAGSSILFYETLTRF